MVWPDFFLLAQPTKLCKVWRNANLRLLVLLVLSVCYVRCSGGSLLSSNVATAPVQNYVSTFENAPMAVSATYVVRN